MPALEATSEDPMWVDVVTGDPGYASELIEAVTGVGQPCAPHDGGVRPVLGPEDAVIGRIRPLGRGRRKGFVRSVFRVPDVSACVELARQLGGGARPLPSWDGAAAYEIRSPDGNAFGVSAAGDAGLGPDGRWPPGGLFAELVVEDLSAVGAFYAPVLGLRVGIFKPPAVSAGVSQPKAGYRILARGATVVAGAIESSFFLMDKSRLGWLVYLEAPDISRAVVAAVELGCRVLVPPGRSPQGLYAVIEDPHHLPWGLGVTAATPEAPG
jgi:predicted enzyme related to lactoylglutathione lyase